MESREAVVPEAFVVGEPIADDAELLGYEMVAALAAVALFGDEAGVEQDAEVLRDGRAAHFEMAGDCARGVIGVREEVEHSAASGVAATISWSGGALIASAAMT